LLQCNSTIATGETIATIVAALKKEHVGLVVLVNRYDGIDLPDDACRILVIDGLPTLRSEYDKYMHSITPTSKLILREQSSNWQDENQITDLLMHYRLRGSDISQNYSIAFTKSK